MVCESVGRCDGCNPRGEGDKKDDPNDFSRAHGYVLKQVNVDALGRAILAVDTRVLGQVRPAAALGEILNVAVRCGGAMTDIFESRFEKFKNRFRVFLCVGIGDYCIFLDAGVNVPLLHALVSMRIASFCSRRANVDLYFTRFAYCSRVRNRPWWQRVERTS